MIDDLSLLELSSISPSVRALLEDEMNKQRKNRILEKHKYAINQCADGRWCTTYYEDGKRKKLSATTESGLYSKLDEIYFGKPKVLSFGEIFEAMCDYQEHEPSHKRTKKTIADWRNTFRRFYKDSVLASKAIGDITIGDIVDMLDVAHEEPLTTQLHTSIKTVYKKTLAYSATRLNQPHVNLFEALDYTEWPTKMAEDKEYYNEFERTILLDYFDNLKERSLPQLAVMMIFETGCRNGEARALRFDDVNQRAIWIRAMARGRARVPWTKSKKKSGERPVAMTNRIQRIVEEAKTLSWSDEFMFVSPIEYCNEKQVLMSEQAVCRALRQACKACRIEYRSPHQIRFSNTTQLIKEGASRDEVKKVNGHAGYDMTDHYTRDFLRGVPVSGVDNAAIIERTHADTNFEEYKKALNREKTQLRAL